LIALTGTLATVVFLFARPLTTLLYPGVSTVQSALTARLVVVLSWLILTNGLIAYSQAVHWLRGLQTRGTLEVCVGACRPRVHASGHRLDNSRRRRVFYRVDGRVVRGVGGGIVYFVVLVL